MLFRSDNVAERRGIGLQLRVRRFKSVHCLKYMPLWWNWKTRSTKDAVALSSAGSSPASGTIVYNDILWPPSQKVKTLAFQARGVGFESHGGHSCIHMILMRIWWNRKTRRAQTSVPKGVRVQISVFASTYSPLAQRQRRRP